MKFLAKLDPMLILVLVVIFGVAITMSTQAATKSSAGVTTTQAMQVDAVDNQTPTSHRSGKS